MTDVAVKTEFRSQRGPSADSAPISAAPQEASPVQDAAPQAAPRKSILVVTETPGIGERVKEAIGLEGEFDVELQNRPISQLLHDDQADLNTRDVLVFEAHPSNDLEMKTLRELRQRCPETTSFLAVTTEPLTLAYAKCLMDINVDEVLPLTSLRNEGDADPDRRGGSDHNGVIITVAKTCGGIGATSTVLNMGIALSEDARRDKDAEPPRIALVDLDFQCGTLGASIDLEDTGAYMDLLRGKREVDHDFLQDAMVPYKEHFDVLPAPTAMAPLDAVSPEMISELLTGLRRNYDYVILDMPRAVTNWIEPILSLSDKMMILTDTSVHSVRQAHRMISLFTEEHISLPIEIVVSKEKKPFSKSEAIKEASNLLERPFDVWLPRIDAKARKAADQGEPILETARKCAIAKPVAQLIEQIKDLRASTSRREA